MTIVRKSNKDINIFWMIIFLFLAFVLTVVVIPNEIKWVWPKWILLFVMFNLTISPSRYGVLFGFCVGLLVDLLMGNSLGVHALSYTIISYFICKMHTRFSLAPLLQQGLFVFCFVLIDFIVNAALTSVIIDWIIIAHSLLASMSSMVIWMLFMGIFYSRARNLARM